MIQRGFADLGVRRVAESMVIHLASRQVMEKAGLVLVRAFHQAWPDPIAGDEHGDVEYAPLKDDWERSYVAVPLIASVCHAGYEGF